MYTEDGFELRPVGDTMEIYASGEIFHEPEPHVVLALRRMQTYFPTTKILSDVRLAAYVLEPDEHDHRSSAIAEVMRSWALPKQTACQCGCVPNMSAPREIIQACP
ncbi:MAG: hypothetical protein NXI03_06820 [Alphaproteobacteria bacterium]|nr:hypothetical protein [Alphaproteobacteria bacterium]